MKDYYGKISFLKAQTGLFSPVYFVVKAFLPFNSRKLISVALLSFLGSLSMAGGFLLLMPLTKYITASPEALMIKGFEIAVTPFTISLLLFLIVVLIFAGIQINYRYYNKTLDVMRATIIESAVRGLEALHAFGIPGNHRQAIKTITNNLAFACGYVMQQFASGVMDTIQLVVFFAALFYINPLITLVFVLFGFISGIFMLQSMSKVTTSVSQRQQFGGEARKEYARLSQDMESGELKHGDLRNKLQSLFDEALMGEMLDQKIGLRRERRRAPLSVEYLFPVALIIIPLVFYLSGSLQQHAPQLVAYLFVLKNVIATMKRLVAQLIATGKFYPGLVCYQTLVTGNELPAYLNQNNRSSADDEEDE